MKMKNKKQTQILIKQEHKKRIVSKKNNRRKEPTLKRRKPQKDQKLLILLVCEGKNTEPSYFNQFKIPSITIKSIGEGYNTITLVNRAKDLYEENDYDEVWCVFDKDDFSAENFNNAILKAKAFGFKVAYSNQAFEYWLILHFEDHQGSSIHRDNYNEKIKGYISPLGVNYDGNGNKIITKDFFELLFELDPKYKKRRVDLAIARAKRNIENFDHRSPASEESSTTVFELVEKLLHYASYSCQSSTTEGN